MSLHIIQLNIFACITFMIETKIILKLNIGRRQHCSLFQGHGINPSLYKYKRAMKQNKILLINK